MQWKTPRVRSFSQLKNDNTTTRVEYVDGTVVYETIPSVFEEQLASVAKDESCQRSCYSALREQLNLDVDRSGTGIAFIVPPQALRSVPAPMSSTDRFNGRVLNTEFFSKRKAYADPQQFDDSSGCTLPTREDLFVVRFINSQADESNNSIRAPLIFKVDQKTGLLAPTARIERSIFDDDFLDLNNWNVVNSTVQSNTWKVGALDGQTSAFISTTGNSNDFTPGTPMNPSVSHIWKDIFFPQDSPTGSVHLHLRIQGNGSVDAPLNSAQDYAAVHLLPITITPQSDQALGFEHRLGGVSLLNRIDSGDYVVEQLPLKTNVMRGSLAGRKYRLVVSFHSGSGLATQPFALAISRLMVVTAVDPPAQPPVRISPANISDNFI